MKTKKTRARRPRAKKIAARAVANIKDQDRLLFVLERLADGVDRIAQRLDSWDGATNKGDHWLDAGTTINPDGDGDDE